MMTTMIRRFRDNDSGVAMISAIGIGFVMTLLATASLVIVTSNNNFAGRQRRSEQAFHSADAGLNRGVFEIEAGIPTTEVSRTIGPFIEESTGTSYLVVVDRPNALQPNHYRITSSAASSRGERRIVRADVNSFNVWDFEFSGAGATAGANESLEGNVDLYGPFYVRGDIAFSGQSRLHTGPIYLKNNPAQPPSARVLTAASQAGEPAPVRSGSLAVTSSGGQVGDTVSGNACGDPALPLRPVDIYAESGIYEPHANTIHEGPGTFDFGTVLDLTLPVLDDNLMTFYYNRADLNLDHNPQASGPLRAGADGVRDGDQPAFILDYSTPSFTYTYLYEAEDPALGEIPGRFEWNQASRTLRIDGVVFADGPVVLGDNSGSNPIFYEGWGTIVANGKITVRQRLRPPLGQESTFPVQNVIGLISNYTAGTNTDASVELSPPNDSANLCDLQVMAAVFGKKLVRLGEQSRAKGILVGGSLCFGNQICGGQKPTLYADTTLSANLPPKMPGTDRITQLVGFHELPVGAPGVPVPDPPPNPAPA